jgi:hypothetical protein
MEMESLPVIKCAACAKYRISTKLIAALVGGKRVGYLETGASNTRTAKRFATMAEFNAALDKSGLPLPTPWVDYDPIMQAMQMEHRRSACKPVFTGD